MVKTIKQIKTLLEAIQQKGYVLEHRYSFNKYDIDKIVENNLMEHRNKEFNKFNVLKLEKEDIKQFEIENKDFAEITKEIKTYFATKGNNDRLKELLEEYRLIFDKIDRYELGKKSFTEIKAEHEKEHIKELVFGFYNQAYYSKTEITNKLYKIIQMFNIILKTDIKVDYEKLDYEESLNNIAKHTNEIQNIFKVKIFGNGKIKIKIVDTKQHTKIRELCINKSLSYYTKDFYVLSDSIPTPKYINLYENVANTFFKLNLNMQQLEQFKTDYPNVTLFDDTLENLNYIDGFGKNNLWRIDYIKEAINDSNLNHYSKAKAI